MKISIRDASRIDGPGYWISPDNTIYKLDSGQSHFQWLSAHQDILMSYDSTLTENDKDIFKKAFKRGWIRVRMGFDEDNLSELIASISAVDIGLLSTLPEEMKSLILSAEKIEFIDISNSNFSFYNKDEMSEVLHMQRVANFVPINLLKNNDK